MLAFADRLTREAVLGERNEKWRPRFHFSSPCGFLNDPHNPVWFRGEYHIFFQYFPQQAEAVRPKCWGHLTTRDFCSWRLLPAAIAPDTELDRDGCASGSALVLGGIMERCGYLSVMLNPLLYKVRRVGDFILLVVISCFVSNFFLGDQYLGIVVPGRMFREAVEKSDLSPRMRMVVPFTVTPATRPLM